MPSHPAPPLLPGLRGTRGPGDRRPRHESSADLNPRCSGSAALQRARHQHFRPCGPSGLCHRHSALPHAAKAAPGMVGVNGLAELQSLQDSRADPPPWPNPRDTLPAIRIKRPCAGPGGGPCPPTGWGAHEAQGAEAAPTCLRPLEPDRPQAPAGPRSLRRWRWVCDSGDGAAAAGRGRSRRGRGTGSPATERPQHRAAGHRRAGGRPQSWPGDPLPTQAANLGTSSPVRVSCTPSSKSARSRLH